MQLLRHFKLLKASSTIESIFSIVIIAISALVFIEVYSKVIMQGKSMEYYNSRHQENLNFYKSMLQNIENYENSENEIFE